MGGRYLVLLGLAVALCRAAVAATDLLTIYNGEAALPGYLRLGEWGGTQTSGLPVRSFTPVAVKTGAFGVPISTLGRYQGTRLDFDPPLDARHFFNSPHNYLECYLRAHNNEGKDVRLPALSDLRVTFFTSAGIGALSIPAERFYPAEIVQDAWVKIALPLSKLNPALRLDGTLHRLVLSCDTPATFLLGRLALVHESTALRAEISTLPAVLETGAPVFFTSGADGGLTPCEVLWDFDTVAGASIDATGHRAAYTYTNPGAYLVTCTVRDVNAARDSVTVTKEIKVVRPR